MAGMLEKVLSTADKDLLPKSYFGYVMLSVSKTDFGNT